MKAEINNENKAKFFALYWGQKVIKDDAFQLLYVSPNINLEHDSWYLNLKPLSSISDEDARDVCRLFTNNFPDDSIASVQGRMLVTEYIKRTSSLIAYDWFLALDYLRSKGYALPWMGLSVEEIVEAGWIRLLDKTH